MKNFLCYLGIIVLIVLIALPPVLRLTLKAEGEEEEEEVHVVRKTLSCDSDSYLTRTSYENDEVKSVTIKKIEVKEENETSDNQDITNNQENQDNTTSPNDEETQSPNETPDNKEEETEFDKLFNTLKEDSRVVKQEVEDGVIIKLDFTTSDYNGLLISDLIKSADEEKIYYENQKMICNIIE